MIKIGSFLMELFKKLKCERFFGTQCRFQRKKSTLWNTPFSCRAFLPILAGMLFIQRYQATKFNKYQNYIK